MENLNQNILLTMLSNETICMSDKLMKQQVELDELRTRYHKLLTSFTHLLEKCEYYRNELGLVNTMSSAERWDYQIVEQAGLLDWGEIDKQDLSSPFTGPTT